MNNKYNTPQLISVCTDMLNINLQLRQKGKEQVQQNLEQMSLEYGINPFNKYNYRQSISLLREEQSKSILFCTDHKCTSRPFVHVQVNPSELDKPLARSLRGDLDWLLGPYYKQFFFNSSVTRLDIAADFHNLYIDDLVCKSLGQRRSGMFWDQSGRTESIYLGHRKSTIQMKIYDKTAKNRSKGNFADTQQVTRIEASVNPNCSFADIAKINNPFKRLRIYKLSDLIADQRLPFSFCDSIHHRGLTATLNLLKPDEREAVKTLLDEHVYQGFPADEIFHQWKLSLRKLLPLKVH